MITVNTNIGEIFGNLKNKVAALAPPNGFDKMLRSMAISTAGYMAYRIHTLGQDSKGAQIGTYSKGYMKVRTGKFATNQVYKSGKRKGETKPTGVFTKGKNKGAPRPKYNRTDDTKIIFSLTRQMENDFSLKETKEPIKTATGYGVGFKNRANADKYGWLNEKYPTVYELSEQEKKKVRDIAEDFIANAFQTR